MQRTGVLDARAVGFQPVVAVGFVDGHGVEHFEDAALDALQFVAGAGQHEQQKEVGHRAHGGFGLTDADGFDEDVAIACGLAQQDGLAGAAGDAAEMAARGRWADEGAFLD